MDIRPDAFPGVVVFKAMMDLMIWHQWAAHLWELSCGRVMVFVQSLFSQLDDRDFRRSTWIWCHVRHILMAVFNHPCCFLHDILRLGQWRLPHGRGGTRARFSTFFGRHAHRVMDGFCAVAGYTARCVPHLDAATNAITIMFYMTSNALPMIFLLKDVTNLNNPVLPFILPSGAIIMFSGHRWWHQALIPNSTAGCMVRLQLTRNGEALRYCPGPHSCGHHNFCRTMMHGGGVDLLMFGEDVSGA